MRNLHAFLKVLLFLDSAPGDIAAEQSNTSSPFLALNTTARIQPWSKVFYVLHVGLICCVSLFTYYHLGVYKS